ncbi:hypothetical protein [Vagococcus hydrophili]|uniref:Uncharacterized protein n=1 Tax=Vagococcus hydrophili TaxID=2714947 RepID=A0A6G8AUI9_9ENTE|nr:hypothetical protein [Vagococcus hydrophili]QIL48724.1 hypothetical protein G7082_09505 [Vagococcus hydrophili]
MSINSPSQKSTGLFITTFLSIFFTITTIISFIYIWYNDSVIVGSGPESGWNLFILVLPQYLPCILLLLLTLLTYVINLIYFVIVTIRNRNLQIKRQD